jgi:hypothetical protein
MLMNLRHRQNGAVLILVVVGMVAMLGLIGLALDSGHIMLNKTRLQNSVDAAALSGAKELDLTGSEVQARAAVILAFAANGAAPGNHEMGQAYADGTIDLEIQFSKTLDPFFEPGSIPAEYVRVRARNFELPTWFSHIVGATGKIVAATAVAGPSPTINVACNVAPMMVCGDPESDAEDNWGYDIGVPDVLKTAAPGSSDLDPENVGPGNFQLIRLGDSHGGADIRTNLAGGFDDCMALTDKVVTEPGGTVGPVAHGINTRFGMYDGGIKKDEALYPSDVITEQSDSLLSYVQETDTIYQGTTLEGDPKSVSIDTDLDYNYMDYNTRLADVARGVGTFDNLSGSYNRRVLAVPVGDCSARINGATTVPVLGFACYFLLQRTKSNNSGGGGAEIFGQFLDACNSGGVPGLDPGDTPGPYIIQLYKDPDSPDA